MVTAHRLLEDSLHSSQIDSVSRHLRSFFSRYYRESGRDFPWRKRSTSPFELLLAEVLLKQTNAEKVVSTWTALVEDYPSPSELTSANCENLVDRLQPLGLQNQRVAALMAISSALVKDHRGEVPVNLSDLLEVPFIGLYTACAVGCFGYAKRLPIVDTNVVRLLGRLTGQDLGNDNRRSGRTWALAWAILPEERYQEHNYGLLDFAAKVCSPRTPRCETCEISAICTFGSA